MKTVPAVGMTIEVRPRYADGRVKQGWSAELIEHSEELLILQGLVQYPEELEIVNFEFGDVLTERYWFNRWYNIFALRTPQGQPKGWYANICTPITFDGKTIRYTDLDLDLWVWPDGRYRVLDEDAFEQRVVPTMPDTVVHKARAALQHLIADLKADRTLFGE
jgi:protein associated with RNAse G/E